MNYLDEGIQAISIGLIVAGFLLNTNRFLTAIELCKECLFILKDGAGIKEENLSKSFYMRIYFIMWKAGSCISDNTNATKYAKKLLQIYRESDERLEEYKLSITLAGEMYFHQSKYAKAIQLTEKVSLISKEGRKRVTCCSGNLNAFYDSVGEYEKSRKSLERSV